MFRAVNQEAARYICEELRDTLKCRPFYDDVDSMYLYLRPIKVALDSMQGNGTNLTDGLVVFDELQDYFADDNEIWNIFNNKWELCGSDLWQASACVDLRYNENYNNIEKDPKYEEYLKYNANNMDNNNNNSNNNNINDEEKEKSIFDSIVRHFRSNINGRGVQRSIDRYLVKINNNGSNQNNILGNRNNRNNRNNSNERPDANDQNNNNNVDLVANGTFAKVFPKPAYLQHRLDAAAMQSGENGLKKQCNALFRENKLVPRGMTPWDFVRPAYLEFRAARGPWNPLMPNFQS